VGLISGKVLLLLLAVFITLGMSLASGLVSYGSSPFACYGGKSFQAVGSPVPWLWVGKLRLKYQPVEWGCDKDHQYDPSQYKVVDGILQPVATP
jgi:hypothetical protein